MSAACLAARGGSPVTPPIPATSCSQNAGPGARGGLGGRQVQPLLARGTLTQRQAEPPGNSGQLRNSRPRAAGAAVQGSPMEPPSPARSAGLPARPPPGTAGPRGSVPRSPTRVSFESRLLLHVPSPVAVRAQVSPLSPAAHEQRGGATSWPCWGCREVREACTEPGRGPTCACPPHPHRSLLRVSETRVQQLRSLVGHTWVTGAAPSCSQANERVSKGAAASPRGRGLGCGRGHTGPGPSASWSGSIFHISHVPQVGDILYKNAGPSGLMLSLEPPPAPGTQRRLNVTGGRGAAVFLTTSVLSGVTCPRVNLRNRPNDPRTQVGNSVTE